MRFTFEQCVVDVDRREVHVDNRPVHVEPQVFDVLVHLMTHRDRVVSKIEFLDEVWGDRFVGESALTSRIKAARRAIGDDGVQQRLIRTVRGHGYRFVGEIAEPDDAATPPPGEAERPRPLSPPTPTTATLPAARTRLVGRDDDLAELVERLRTKRLVTLAGPGGAGKSSLAMTAARELVAQDGVEAVFAELAPAQDRQTLVRTVAEAAGIEGAAATELTHLAQALGARRMLLVVDNCEHLLDASAELVDAVLDAGADVTVLTTSREPLMVAGEVLHQLGSLGEHASALFAERAAAATGDRELVLPDDPRVVELCRQLDGLPLAIELAAAQLRHLTVDDLLTRLDDRLDLLRGGRPRAGARHSALAATVAWSHELLREGSRRLFDRLAVFPASFDMAAAIAVSGADDGATVAAMADLVAKNLLVHDRGRRRYLLLETIRLYAAERLESSGERDELVERLRGHVVARATASPRHRIWPSTALAAASLEDLDNVRLAFDASLRADAPGDALDIAVGVAPLWRNTTSYAEGLGWAERLRAAELPPRDELWLLLVQADLGLGSGDHRMLVDSATAAAELAGRLDEPEAAVIAAILCSLVLLDPGAAVDGLVAAGAAAQDLGEPDLARVARAFLVIPLLLQGRTAELDDVVAAITADTVQGDYADYIGHWSVWLTWLVARDGQALRRVMDSQLENVRRSGMRENWLMTYSNALTLIAEGRDHLEPLVRARRRAHDEGHATEADTVLVLAYERACSGDFERAAELVGASSTTLQLDTAGFVHHVVIRERLVRPNLDPAAFAAAVERGRGLAVPQLLAEHGL